MRRIQVALILVLALVLLSFTFYRVDLRAVGRFLAGADPGLVLAAVAASLLTVVYRAFRWKFLLLPIKRVPLAPLVACTFMGWTLNVIVPGRVGEVLRPALLGQREGLSKSAAVATVLVERAFDTLALLLYVLMYPVLFPMPSAAGSEVLRWMTVLSAVGVVGLIVLLAGFLILGPAAARLSRWPLWLDGIIARVPERWQGRIVQLGSSFARGLQGLREPRLIGLLTVHSLGLWALIGGAYYLVVLALGIELPFYAMVHVVAIAAIGVLVPTPAAVGSYHRAVQFGMVAVWGVGNEAAVGFALLAHAVSFLPAAAIGLVLLAREGLTLRLLRGLGERATRGAG